MPSYKAGTPREEITSAGTLPHSVQTYLVCGAPEGGRNKALLDAACQLRDANFPQGEAEAILGPRAQVDGLPVNEITTTIKHAFSRPPREPAQGASGAFQPRGGGNWQPQQPKRERKPLAVSSAPPPPPKEGGFADFLRAAFREGEGVCISAAREMDDGAVVPERGVTLSREAWLAKVEQKGGIDKAFTTKLGLYVRVNPMVPGGSDKDVTNYRHLLVEFDKDANGQPIPKERQFGAMLASGLPITAVIDSGNKSLHAWVRVDARNEAEYRDRATAVYELFEGLHLDGANKNPSRLSRCPDGWRTVGGERRQQKLLQLNVGAADFAAWENVRDAEIIGTPRRWKEIRGYDVPNDPNNVLGNRWLCRGAGFVLVGQSGVGKSSLNMQLAIGWALNRPDMTFGVKAIRPLRQIVLQAENDDGDLAEAAQGVADAFGLDAAADDILEENLRWQRITTLTGADFTATAARLVEQHKPDILWIDPLLNFLGDDASDAHVISDFCARQLGTIALRSGCIIAFMHHMGKPPKDARGADSFTNSDLAYAGLGSSMLTNWAREVAVLKRVFAPPGDPPTFKLSMCKRRKRAGLKDPETLETVEEIFIRHAHDGTIRWEQCEEPPPPPRNKGGRPRGSAQGERAAVNPSGRAESPAQATSAQTTYVLKRTAGGRPEKLDAAAQAAIVASVDAHEGKLTRAERSRLASTYGVSESTVKRFAAASTGAEPEPEPELAVGSKPL